MSVTIEETGVRWEVWFDDARGNRDVVLDQLSSVEVVKTANTIGAWQVTMPAGVIDSKLSVDRMLEFWRGAAGEPLKFVGVGFLRKWIFAEDENGNDVTILSGPDEEDLLNRRIVAYDAGSAQAAMTDQADDMLKAIVVDAIGADAGTGRDLTSLGLTVAGDLAAGPSITKAFSWRKVFYTLQDICEASRQAGTELYFDLVPVISGTTIGFNFRTSTGQPGMDRTGDAPVIFGKEWGNLERPQLTYDYSKEENYIYSGGRGIRTDREIVEVSDTARIGASPWNRREMFVNPSGQESTTNGYTAAGNQALAAGRPKMKFSGQLKDTADTRYGRDWQFGDRVIVVYRGRQLEGPVKSITFRVSNRGETIYGGFEVEE